MSSQLARLCCVAARRFLRSEAGGVVVLLGLALVPLIGTVGLAVDAGAWYGERARLQAAADSAAIAAARELRIANSSADQLELIAEASARDAVAARGFDPGAVVVDAVVDMRAYAVRLRIDKPLERAFSRAVTDLFARVSVAATARITGSAPICVIGLDPTESKTVHLQNSAQLEAPGCAVYSNSTHNQGLRIDNFAEIRAALICSSGGTEGPHASFRPTPRTDCPPIPDPLIARSQPRVGSCTHHDLVVTADTYLAPGVYCGGLRIRGGAQVSLGSGLYVIKDGPLRVDRGSLVGRYTSFFFTGDNAAIDFHKHSSIDLTAMRDGPIAGILFFEDRAAPPGRDFKIESDDARNLLGTIYLPRGDFFVDAGNRVADRSAYTVIVARRLELSAGPILTLNTDYGATDIPVPEGVGPTGDVVLSQ